MNLNNKFELKDFINNHPGSPLFARLAELHLKDGESAEALEICKAGLRYNENSAIGHYFYAKAAVMEADYETAIRHLQSAVKLDPEFLSAYGFLLEILPVDADPAQVTEYCKYILRINPEDLDARGKLEKLTGSAELPEEGMQLEYEAGKAKASVEPKEEEKAVESEEEFDLAEWGLADETEESVKAPEEKEAEPLMETEEVKETDSAQEIPEMLFEDEDLQEEPLEEISGIKEKETPPPAPMEAEDVESAIAEKAPVPEAEDETPVMEDFLPEDAEVAVEEKEAGVQAPTEPVVSEEPEAAPITEEKIPEPEEVISEEPFSEEEEVTPKSSRALDSLFEELKKGKEREKSVLDEGVFEEPPAVSEKPTETEVPAEARKEEEPQPESDIGEGGDDKFKQLFQKIKSAEYHPDMPSEAAPPLPETISGESEKETPASAEEPVPESEEPEAVSAEAKHEEKKKTVAKKSPVKKRKSAPTGKAKKNSGKRAGKTKAKIAPELATWTMYAIYKKQELYENALAILDILETKKPEDRPRIKTEREIIQQLIEAKQDIKD